MHFILAVKEDDRRCLAGFAISQSFGEPGLSKGRCCPGPVAHTAQVGHRTTLHGFGLGAHAAHDLSILEQPVGLILIIDPDIEQNARVAQQGQDNPGKPGGEAIGVDAKSQGGPAVFAAGSHVLVEILLQLPDLEKMFEQQLARPGWGRRYRPGEQDLAGLFFQQPDALGNRRLRQIERFGSFIEAALVEYRRQGFQEFIIEHALL